MTKKILLLVLLLPLIIMISLFTTTNTVSLAIDIPVTGIEIVSDNIVYLSLDSSETYHVDYTVYPTNATKQEVSFKTEEVEGSRLAKLEYNNGVITPKTVGMAKVTLTTIDGGFKDSFIVQVESNSLQEIESKIESSQIYVGEKTYIQTSFIPANTSNQLLDYESNNPSVATVDSRGYVSAVGKGIAEITITSQADNSIKSVVSIEVLNKDIMDLSETSITTWNMKGTMNVSIDTPVDYELSYEIYDGNLNLLDNGIMNVTLSEVIGGNATLNYEFLTEYVGSVIIEVTIETSLGLVVKKSCVINRVDEVEVSFDNEKTLNYETGVTAFMLFTLNPSDADVTYEVSANNQNVNVRMYNGNIIIQTVAPGVSTVTLKVHVNGVNVDKIATVDVVVVPKAFTISEIANTYGIENIWTIGKTDILGNNQTFDLTLSYGKVNAESGFFENITWVTDTNAVKVTRVNDVNGRIEILDSSFTGIVTIKAVYSYGDYTLESAPFKVRCVGDGVNVYNYEELLKATKMDSSIILHKSIKEDFGYYADGTMMNVSDVYTEIKTTYDWTYYKNLGYVEAPKVKVLISFKNDVYGNGNTINAHNIAYGLDSTGALKSDALFRGPLNFTAVTDSNSSAVSVKAQDNIIFAAYEGVSINNIELRGCDLEADMNGSYDLTDLNYVGTVVEVLGDGVEINYSRITNGRMGVRIFGDIIDPNKVINTSISNTILSGAREFIIRMGSNAFVDGTVDTPAPYLPNNTITEFPVYTTYKQMNSEEKKAYDQAYIKTFVTVKDSAFKDCGIFSIGIDSHFAGAALADAYAHSILQGKDFFKYWYDLAKTSYGSKLTFDGDVRIYDWKPLEQVDSSTLIEIIQGSQVNELFANLKFDVAEMVDKLSNDSRFSNIIYKNSTYKDGKAYVHGGIAFFGGGKNYGVFEEVNNENSFASYNGYQVSLDDIGKSQLSLAAGNEEFYFLLHDSTTLNFLPPRQDELLSSENAYEFVYKK